MEGKEKSKKGIIITIIVMVVIIVIGILGIFAYHGQQLTLLTAETQKALAVKIVNNDGTINKEAKIDMEIKTNGSYSIVEETFKNYLNETLILAQQADSLYSQEEIENTLSIENIKSDGPDFVQTKEKIAQMKKEGEEYINKFIELCNEKNLLAEIEDKQVSSYYKELYKQLATDEGASKELENTILELEVVKTDLLAAFDYLNSIVVFLSDNKSSWTIEGDQIVFYSQDKLDEYQKLISEVPGE